MSTMIKFGLVSLLSAAVLAIPTPSDYIPSRSAPALSQGTGHFKYHAGNGSEVYSPTGTGRHQHRKHRLTTTSTRTSTEIFTQYVTVSPVPAPSVAAEAVEAAAYPASPALSSSCSTPTVYETQLYQVTVTSTLEDVPQQTYAAAAEPAPEPTTSSAPAPAAYASTPTEPEVVSLTYKPVGKQVAAPTDLTNVAAAAVAPVVASAAAGAVGAVESAVSSSSSSKKRGVAYNDLQYTECFANQGQISWAYNWGQSSGGVSNAFEYVPMLWGTRSDFTSNWVSNAKSALSSGSTHMLAFNEPDLAAQSNMDPATAAAAYKTYIHDNFAGGSVRLGSPAVTNGGGDMGLTWLSNFMTACSGCQIDFVAIHWYDAATNVQYFKDHVTQANTQTGKPVWITEFGATGSDADVQTFLQTVLPWLDSQPFVERYSYFMATDGNLNSGTAMSARGNTFAMYTS